jgi:tetratricopeptide (TPR) repeat protein
MRGAFTGLEESLAAGLAAARQLHDRRAESTLLMHLAGRYAGAGDAVAAVTHWRQALELKREIGDRLGELAVLNNLAGDELCVGQYRSALTHLAAATGLIAELGRDDLSPYVRMNTGLALFRLGRYDEAVPPLRAAMDGAVAHGLLPTEGYARDLLGRILTRGGDYAGAERHLRAAIAVARRAAERRVEAYALDALAALYRERGLHGAALEHHAAALVAVDGLGMDQAEQLVRIGYGEGLLAFGRPARAAAEFRRAVDLHRTVGDPYLGARAQLGMGDAAAATGDHAEATRHWSAALADFTELGCAEAEPTRRRLSAGSITDRPPTPAR